MKHAKTKLAIVLGIRPDVIRASIILEILKARLSPNRLFLIWSGQHYSENLKDVFFRQLDVAAPTVELGANGETDAELVSSMISKLYPVLRKIQPSSVVFLGDTNTVMSCIAAAQLNIPIVHIEGCMRSYDWRMPEEKYRLVADHLSDVIYAYLDEYKKQGVAEGLNPNSIVVTGNPIVDVLNKCYFAKREHYERIANPQFFHERGIKEREYYVMTCHRRENVLDSRSLKNIIKLVEQCKFPIYFPASYRTQNALSHFSLTLPRHVTMVDPIGYEEFLALMANSRGVISDSGTVIEEACIMNVPAMQMRKSTERPQVYDVGACVKYDPTAPQEYQPHVVLAKLDALWGQNWVQPFGDGKASERIASDLLHRLDSDDFQQHEPEDYSLAIQRSFRNDII
jgi:UDP-N-acetylglucosamine 2-epimerase (non-hydrolysing)